MYEEEEGTNERTPEGSWPSSLGREQTSGREGKREKDGRSVISQSPFARSRSRMNETTYLKRGEWREREKRIGTIESRSGREVV